MPRGLGAAPPGQFWPSDAIAINARANFCGASFMPPCAHAITDISPIARCLRYGRPAPANRAANPAAKRPNAIHLGCMAKPRRQAPALLLTRYNLPLVTAIPSAGRGRAGASPDTVDK